MDHRAERTTEQLSVLIIEDSEADAELITRQLVRENVRAVHGCYLTGT